MAVIPGNTKQGVKAEDNLEKPLPEADYEFRITNSEFRETSKKDGWILLLTLKVISGEFKDHVTIVRLNWINPNVQAQSIGRAELSRLMIAVGLPAGKPMFDTVDLHNRPFMGTVVHRVSNEYLNVDVKKFRPLPVSEHASAPPPPRAQATTKPIVDDPSKIPGVTTGNRLPPKPAPAPAPAPVEQGFSDVFDGSSGDSDNDIPF